MAVYDVFREQLAIKFPACGHALWDPSPPEPNRPVRVGDVGFIRKGKFHRLFNVLQSQAEQSSVPTDHEQLVPQVGSSNHITQETLSCGNYCSVGVGVQKESYSSGPDDFERVLFNHPRRQGAALSLPVKARRENTLAQSVFGEWMVKHVDRWFSFARQLDLGIENMEEIILVTGCDRTVSWANVTFFGAQDDAQASFGVKHFHRDDPGNIIRFSREPVEGAVLNHGPEGAHLPENQTVFVRGFRVTRTSKIFPRRPISAIQTHRDPLHVLLDYISEQAPDCDMALIHDDDLERIYGLGEESSLETLRRDVIMDLLQRSNIEIHKVCCDLSPADSPNANTSVVWLAMLSTLSENWSSVLHSQRSVTPAVPWQNPGLGPRGANELPVRSPSALQNCSSVLRIPGGINSDDSAPRSRLDCADGLPTLDEIGCSPSVIWSSLSKLAYVEHHQLVPGTIVVAYCMASFLSWIFPSTWPDMSEHWSTFLFSSSVLIVWSGREQTHRRLDEMHETIKAIQRHITSSRSNPGTPALEAEAQDIFPIMAKSNLTNQERLRSHKEEEGVREKNGTEGQQKAKDEDMLGAIVASEYPSPPGFNIRCQGSPTAFGSIDDAPAPISSSSASAPGAKPAGGTIFFGTIAVYNGRSDSAKSAVPHQPPPLADLSTSSSQTAPAAPSTPSPSPNIDEKGTIKLISCPSTQSHAISPTHHLSHPSISQPHHSVISPPSTPPAANQPKLLNANADVFFPAKAISIKNTSGQEITLDTRAQPAIDLPLPSSPVSVKKDNKQQPIQIESQEQKEKRLAEEREKEGESEDKTESSDTLVRATEAAARPEIEEQELHEAEECKAKEEAERVENDRKEAEERAVLEKERRGAEERARQEEKEHTEAEEHVAWEAREKEEEERIQEARTQREVEEKVAKERAEQEWLRKLIEEEEARAKEEAERQRTAEENKIKAVEASENAHSLPYDAPMELTSSLPEEDEVDVDVDVSQPATIVTEEPALANESAAAPQAPPSTPPSPHIPMESSVKPVEMEQPRIDASLPPSPEQPQRRSGSSDFQTTTTDIAPPVPSALATARYIEDINRITYPQGIKSPKLELNVNTQKGKFRYDRDFLLQFMNICKEKLDNLPPLDLIGLDPTNKSRTMSWGDICRNRNSRSMPPETRSASFGLSLISPSMDKSAGNGFQMGQFTTSASKMSSEEHFLAASAGHSVPVTDDPLGSHPPEMVCTISQSSTHHDCVRGKRGATDTSHASAAGNAGSTAPVSAIGPLTEPVAPLQMSANRWVATSTLHNGAGFDTDSSDMVNRKVTAFLNKLTVERFDSISDQIVAWANKSAQENDGQTLLQVIKLVFEMATNGTMFSEMYARLCHKMMERVSPKVQDGGIKNAEGKPFTDGQLFRKYLLNCCQEDFERRWVDKEAIAAAAATEAAEDRAIKKANEKRKGGEESGLYSDEYYAVAKAKRRGLGLIRFMGELFKLRMLTERIMHECIKKFVGNLETPEMEEIEGLCELLTTVGSLLDTPKARAHLDVYFSRMWGLMENKTANARMGYMLHGVIELRERRWVTRSTVASPTTIAQVREEATKGRRSQKIKGLDDDVTGEALAEAKAKVEEDTTEFFSIRMLDKAESYFSSIPARRRHLLVDALVTKSIEMKEPDVVLVSELFIRVREKGLCGPRVFERGFNGLAKALDDLTIDIPKAWTYFAILLRGSGLHQDEVRRGRIAEKTMDPDKLNRLL